MGGDGPGGSGTGDWLIWDNVEPTGGTIQIRAERQSQRGTVSAIRITIADQVPALSRTGMIVLAGLVLLLLPLARLLARRTQASPEA